LGCAFIVTLFENFPNLKHFAVNSLRGEYSSGYSLGIVVICLIETPEAAFVIKTELSYFSNCINLDSLFLSYKHECYFCIRVCLGQHCCCGLREYLVLGEVCSLLRYISVDYSPESCPHICFLLR